MPEFADLATVLATGGYKKANPYDARRKMAQQMMAQGMDTSPVQSPWQGAARLAQALAGGFDSYMVDKEEKDAEKKRADAFAAFSAEKDPAKQIAMLPALDMDTGIRAAGQLAIERYKQDATRQNNADAGRLIGSSYGMSGGQMATGGPTQLPQGAPAPGGFANNAGNIRTTQAAWPGEGPPQNGFKTFATPQDGINAMVRNYQAYIQQNPNMTVGQALQKWAPPNENDSYGYLRTITEGTGINPGMPLAELMRDPAAFAQFLEAQTRLEKGGVPQGFTPDHFSNATQPQQPPAGVQPGGLQIDMPGPRGAAPPNAGGQGADGMPPAPNPQTVTGQQAVVAPPAVPDVPRPQPTPQQLQDYQQRIRSGEFGIGPDAVSKARAALDAELDRQWGVDRQRRELEYKQQLGDYQQANKQRGELEQKAPMKFMEDRINNYETKTRPAAVNAVSDILAIHSVRQVLDAGAFTGTGADIKQFGGKLLAQLGLPSDTAVNTQVLGSVLAKRLLAQAGGSLGNQVSNKDAEIINNAAGGSINIDEKALRTILDVGEREARRLLKHADSEAARIRTFPGMSAFSPESLGVSEAPTYAEWSKANPLVVPQVAPVPGQMQPNGIATHPNPNAPTNMVPAGVPQGAVEMLRSNPGLADAFDAKYGPGSAARVLGR